MRGGVLVRIAVWCWKCQQGQAQGVPKAQRMKKLTSGGVGVRVVLETALQRGEKAWKQESDTIKFRF